jgi:hypothetical protein
MDYCQTHKKRMDEPPQKIPQKEEVGAPAVCAIHIPTATTNSAAADSAPVTGTATITAAGTSAAAIPGGGTATKRLTNQEPNNS